MHCPQFLFVEGFCRCDNATLVQGLLIMLFLLDFPMVILTIPFPALCTGSSSAGNCKCSYPVVGISSVRFACAHICGACHMRRLSCAEDICGLVCACPVRLGSFARKFRVRRGLAVFLFGCPRPFGRLGDWWGGRWASRTPSRWICLVVAVGVYLGTRLILSWLSHSSGVCNLLDWELAGVSPGQLLVGQELGCWEHR